MTRSAFFQDFRSEDRKGNICPNLKQNQQVDVPRDRRYLKSFYKNLMMFLGEIRIYVIIFRLSGRVAIRFVAATATISNALT